MKKENEKQGMWTRLFAKITKSDKSNKADKKIKNKDLKEYLKYVIRESNIHMNSEVCGPDTKFMYDFIKERYDGNRLGGSFTMEQGIPMAPINGNDPAEVQDAVARLSGTSISVEKKDLEIKIEVRPVDIVHELERVPTSWSTVGIDEKIIILEEKGELIQNSYAKKEVTGLVERLKNRKKYFAVSKTGETFKEFFTKFDPTTEEKVDDLLKKYPHLTLKESDLFVPEFPDVAITTMKAYSDKCVELCGKKPVFQVIAPVKMFKEKYKRRDPILLAQSPFGYYFDILGAWDEEMILLGEL